MRSVSVSTSLRYDTTSLLHSLTVSQPRYFTTSLLHNLLPYYPIPPNLLPSSLLYRLPTIPSLLYHLYYTAFSHPPILFHNSSLHSYKSDPELDPALGWTSSQTQVHKRYLDIIISTLRSLHISHVRLHVTLTASDYKYILHSIPKTNHTLINHR